MPPSAKCSACALVQPPNASSTVTSLILGKRARSAGSADFGLARPVEVLGDDLLAGRRVEEIEIGLGHLAGAALVDHLVDQRDRRLGQDREGGHDDLELVGAELLQGQEGLVLPGDQHVADGALGEGGGRAARAGIEHRHVAVDRLDELARRRLVALGPVELVGPGGEIVPARAARRLGIGRHDRDAVLGEVGPVLDGLGISLAHHEHDGRGVGRGVVGQARLPVGRQALGLAGDGVDVAGQRQGDDVGFQPVDHRARLLARAAVRGADGDLLAGAGLPLLGEGVVQRTIELARGIVRHVGEHDLGRGLRARGGGRAPGPRRHSPERDKEGSTIGHDATGVRVGQSGLIGATVADFSRAAAAWRTTFCPVRGD